MAYPKTIWQDHSVTRPNTYVMTQNQDSTVTLTPAEGTVLQEGTPVNATNLNKIENELEALDDRTYALNGSGITGVLPVTKGGTGATTTAGALSALGAAGSSHTHALSGDSLTGSLPVTKGGTGATTKAAARAALEITPANIGAAASSHSHSLGDLSGTLGVTKGGTGATSAPAARTALGITPANIGAAPTVHTHALNSSDMTSTLPVTKGGTGWSVLEAGKVLIGRGTNASVELKDFKGTAWDGAHLFDANNSMVTSYTLPKAGTWLIFTGHNSTPGANTAWMARTAGNNIFRLAIGNGQTSVVEMALTGTTLKVTPTGVTVGVYGIFLG